MTPEVPQCICDIGVGAGPAGLVSAGPLFSGKGGGGGGLMKFIIYIIFLNACVLCARLLQPDHFKSPSFAPV